MKEIFSSYLGRLISVETDTGIIHGYLDRVTDSYFKIINNKPKETHYFPFTAILKIDVDIGFNVRLIGAQITDAEDTGRVITDEDDDIII